MNIIYFHQHFSTPGGSTGIRSYEMARMLIKKGHKVTMVCGSYNVANTGTHEILLRYEIFEQKRMKSPRFF